MNSFSTTWTNDSRVGARARGKGGDAGGDRSGEDEDQQALHATSFIRGIFAASGMIRAASTSNHCSTSEE